MSKKKKRKKHPEKKQKDRKDTPIFNSAFRTLGSLKDASSKLDEVASDKKPEIETIPDENAIFREALWDVSPLSHQKDRIIKRVDTNIRPKYHVQDDEFEGLAYLTDLVSGQASLDITFSDEYIEGAVTGFSPKIMDKLKKGQYPIQDHVDLHGLKREEAEIAIKDFLLKSRRLGLRCVLIVHGRGLNSKDHIPVLKNMLLQIFKQSPLKKVVLAFSTAMPYDGGTGAVYVLLRK